MTLTERWKNDIKPQVANAQIKKSCTPRGGESEQDFISRCIREEIKAGATQDEAAGKCYGIWRQKQARKTLLKQLESCKKRLEKVIKKRKKI